VYPESIQKLIDLFSKFPTVGPRTAARFVFYLLRLDEQEVNSLTNTISELKDRIKVCRLCFNHFQTEGELCQICDNPSRDKSTLLVVEKESDLSTIENTKKYKGRYFVLGGTVSSLKKKEIDSLRKDELIERVKDDEVKEVILGINSTTEGEATILYLERLLTPLNKKITRLGRGLPTGSELEYADDETLSSAIDSRR